MFLKIKFVNILYYLGPFYDTNVVENLKKHFKNFF